MPELPLRDKRIVITRTREQAGTLATLLAERGAIPIELPTIRIAPPDDWEPLDRALRALSQYDWVIFTSANGVRVVAERLDTLGLAPGALQGRRLAAIGPATAAALSALGARVDFVPSTYVAEAIVDELRRFDLADRRILLPRAREARAVLATGLRAQGALVDEVAAYATQPAGDAEAAQRLFAAPQRVDVVTLTSSSTARNLVGLLGEAAPRLLASSLLASIGPITSATARELGLVVGVEAAEHTIPGLVASLERYFKGVDP